MEEKMTYWQGFKTKYFPDLNYHAGKVNLLNEIALRCNIANTDTRTNAELAVELGCCRKTITRYLSALVEHGYITISGHTSGRRIGLTDKALKMVRYNVKATYPSGAALPVQEYIDQRKSTIVSSPKKTCAKAVPSSAGTPLCNNKNGFNKGKSAPKVDDDFGVMAFEPARLSQSQRYMNKTMRQ